MALEELTTQEWLDLMMDRWHQGQHLTIIGETGTGKTELASQLLDLRTYVVVLAVKKHDDTLHSFEENGYTVISKWPPEYQRHRVILWARPNKLDDLPKQRATIMRALESMYTAGGWTCYVDDLTYVFNFLRIKAQVGILLNQGRSSKLTMVSAVTRPIGVLRDNFVQATYHIAFPFVDERDIATMSQVAGVSRQDMVYWNRQLRPHDFLSFDRVRRDVLLVRNTR